MGLGDHSYVVLFLFYFQYLMRDMESVLRQKKFLTLTKEITEPNRNKYLAIKKKKNLQAVP